MAKPSKKSLGTKVKKKIWIPVIAPKLFNEKVIADTPVTEAQQCVGRHVQTNMTALTGDMRAQSIHTKLLITDVKEGKAYSQIVRYEITSPALKRFVRRNRDRIDESLVYMTRDNIKVRLKPFILTQFLTKSSIKSELRRKLKLFLFKKVSTSTYDDLFYSIISNKLQKEIKGALSKTYPVKNVEIRVIHKEKDDAKITPAPAYKEKPKDEEEILEQKKSPKEAMDKKVPVQEAKKEPDKTEKKVKD